MSKARLLMAIAFSSGLGGCGTCFTFIGFPGGGPASDELRPGIFGGVSLDGRALSKDRPTYHGTDLSIVQLFILFDVPLSLAMDIATLPITIPIEIFRKPDPKKLGPEEEARHLAALRKELADGHVGELVSGLRNGKDPSVFMMGTLGGLRQEGIDAVQREMDRTTDPVLQCQLHGVLEKLRQPR